MNQTKDQALKSISRDVFDQQSISVPQKTIVSNVNLIAETNFGFGNALLISNACNNYLKLQLEPSIEGFYNYLSTLKASDL